MISFWTYFGLELKMMIKKIPQIILGLIAFVLIIMTVAGTGIIALNKSGDKSFDIIRVGVVGDINDRYTKVAIEAIKEMKSLNKSFEFEFYKKEADAQKKLESDNLDILFVVPDEYVEGFMHGENKKVEVRFSKGDTEVSYYVVTDMSYFVSTVVTESERNIYTLQDYYRAHEKDESYDSWYELNKRYFTETLTRADAFKGEQVSATDDLSFEKYYLCNGTILLFLLLGMVCSGIFRDKNETLDKKLNVAGIGYSKRLLSRLVSFIIVFEILYILYISILIPAVMTGNATALGDTGTLVTTMLSGLLIIIPICTFILFVYELTGSRVMGVFGLFVLILLFGLLSGTFYPLWFMPKKIIDISDIWLFKIMFNFMKGCLLGKFEVLQVLFMGLYEVGMISVLVLVNRMKKE